MRVRDRVRDAVRGLRAEGYGGDIDVVVDGARVLVRGHRGEGGEADLKIEVGRGRAKAGEWEGVDPGTLAGIAAQELATEARTVLVDVLAADPADDVPPPIYGDDLSAAADPVLPVGPTIGDALRAVGACRAAVVTFPDFGAIAAAVTLSTVDTGALVGEWFAKDGKTFWATAHVRTGTPPSPERIGSDWPLTAVVQTVPPVGSGRPELFADRVVRSEGKAIVTTRAAYRASDWARRGTKGDPTEQVVAFAHNLATVHGGPDWKAFLPSVMNADLQAPAGDSVLAHMEHAGKTIRRIREANPAMSEAQAWRRWSGPSSPIRACYLARDGFAFVLSVGLAQSFHIVLATDLERIAEVLEAWGPLGGADAWDHAVRAVCPGTSFWRAQAAAAALTADATDAPAAAADFGAGIEDGAAVVYSKSRGARDRLTAAIDAARASIPVYACRHVADDESWSVLNVGTVGGRVPGGAWVGHRHGGGPLAPMFVFGSELAAIEYFNPTGTVVTERNA